MEIEYSKNFLKNYRKRIQKESNLDQKFRQKLSLLTKNPKNSLLKKHSLRGKMKKYCAFSVTGNCRVIYKIKKNIIELYDIGSHNQVYK